MSLAELVHLALVASFGLLIWWAIRLQQQWDSATELPAVVIALDPPAPSALPNEITIEFEDANGTKRRQTLGYMQFLTTPKLGDELRT